MQRGGGKKHEKMLGGLTKWLKVGRVTEGLKETRDREDVGWTNKVAQSRESDRRTERDKR